MSYLELNSPPSSGTGGVSSVRKEMLHAAVIIDYQNLNLTGQYLFSAKNQGFKSFINPLLFSQNLLARRNKLVNLESKKAILSKVLVFRGLPSPDHDPKLNSLNIIQARNWQKSNLVHVTHRPLKYYFDRNSRRIIGRAEKGIDVLCALALVREAQKSDLVILASQDTDLMPAVEEAYLSRKGRIETCSWFDRSKKKNGELRFEKIKILNTHLDREIYLNSLD